MLCVEMLDEIEGGSVKMEKRKSRNEGQIQKECRRKIIRKYINSRS